MQLFLSALGLMLVFEGVLPFLKPGFWRHMLLQVIQQSDRSVRVFGLVSMLVGLAILYMSR